MYAFTNFERLTDAEYMSPSVMPHDIPPEALRKVLQGRKHVIVPSNQWRKLYAFKAGGDKGKDLRKQLGITLNPFHSEEELRKLFPTFVFWRQFFAKDVVDGMKPSNWEHLVISDVYWDRVFKYQPANVKNAAGHAAPPSGRRLDMAAGAAEDAASEEEEEAVEEFEEAGEGEEGGEAGEVGAGEVDEEERDY